MKKAFILIAAAFLAAGCASSWEVRTEPSGSGLQWPDTSGRTVLRHTTTVTGFRQNGSNAGSILRRIVFGPSNEGSFMQPVALSVGSDGRIAVADAGCSCVHLFLPKERRYERIEGTGTEHLRSPVSLTFDNDHLLYVSDSAQGAVFVFGDRGQPVDVIRRAGDQKLQRPTGLAYASGPGILYLTDTAAHRVHAFGPDKKLSFSIGGRGEEPGKFNFPTHIHSSENGTLHVTDSMNFRVQTFSVSGQFVSSFGRHGDGSGDFAMPKGVAVDREGIFYVVDSLFDNVQLFNEQGEFLLTLGSRGIGESEFWLPSGIFLDKQNNLYVCDTYNQRVQIFRIGEAHEYDPVH